MGNIDFKIGNSKVAEFLHYSINSAITAAHIRSYSQAYWDLIRNSKYVNQSKTKFFSYLISLLFKLGPAVAFSLKNTHFFFLSTAITKTILH